ncbi:hypothetical protein [Thalassoroseus pseudoceratinae]|uniref:hypothetical protein n=1 Tax=Thalassoroseus pseudoceratinae TaxID=2713176 RepID=UPI00141D74CD|nr:hypothetical protein [Thalassoroseus pseudoceratinae]
MRFSARISVWMLLLVGFIGCGGNEEPKDAPPAEKKNTGLPADPVQAPLIAPPSGSGYVEGGATVQLLPDPPIREVDTPKNGPQFLLVRIPVEKQAQFVPADYKIEIEENRYEPHAVGFGQAGQIYASVDELVGETVELQPSAKDEPQHDGRKIRRVMLGTPQVVLLYDVPKVASPVLRHGEDAFPLNPDLDALKSQIGDDAVSSMAQTTGVRSPDQMNAAPSYAVQVVDAERLNLDITGVKTNAVRLVVEVVPDQAGRVTLNRKDLALIASNAGPTGRGGPVFFDFMDIKYQPVYNSEIQTGERFENRELFGLLSGGVTFPVDPAEPARMQLFFPNPPATSELYLHFPGVSPVSLADAVEPLSKFPTPETRMPDYVARAPIVGEAVDAKFLSGSVPMADNPANWQATRPQTPGSGQRFLTLEFKVSGDAEFTPNDYVLFTPGVVRYQPVAVSFGGTDKFVRGLGYSQMKLTTGPQTAPVGSSSQPTGWTLAKPTLTLLYELPSEPRYVFVHGETQFVIEIKN